MRAVGDWSLLHELTTPPDGGGGAIDPVLLKYLQTLLCETLRLMYLVVLTAFHSRHKGCQLKFTGQ
jgi:hypothetical protein